MSSGADTRVAIVGLGRFGRSLAALCDGAGLTWSGYDPREPSTRLEEALAEADLVVLAVPLDALRAAIASLRPHLVERQLLIETCSVKLAALPALEPLVTPWIASHPLFGPGSLEPGAPPMRAVVCGRPDRPELAARARAFYQRLGCLVEELSADEHDRRMARTQALAAFVGAGLRELGPTERAWIPPSVAPLAQLAESQNAAPGHLRDTLLHDNPYAAEVRAALIEALTALSLPCPRPGDDDARALARLREAIDEVDRGLLALLARRAVVARAISQRKADLGREVRDPAREAAAFVDRRRWAEARGIDADFIEQIFEAILPWSRTVQERARGEDG